MLSNSKVRDFKKLLDEFDWFYAMSDDPRWWEEGKRQEKKILQIVSKDPELDQIYRKEKQRIFS